MARRRRRPIRALSHVPPRRPARDDDPRSRHRVPAVRRTRRAGCVGPRRPRGPSTWSTASAPASWGSPVAVRRATAPLVLNPQGLEEFGATDPSRARLKRAAYLPLRRAVLACARAADCVIATDRSLEPIVRAHLELDPERVCVIPNALDLPELDALAPPRLTAVSMRARQRIPAADTVLLSVGRLEQNKGFHVLVGRARGAPRPCGTDRGRAVALGRRR